MLALMACAAGGAIFDNSGSTHAPAALEPRAVSAVLGYLQMYQVWTMFAPDVPTTAKTVAVDAVTADGRHVDPLNEALSPGHPLEGGAIPPRLGNNGFASAYLGRLPYSPDYFTALGEWLLRYPERTHRNADRIVSFRVATVEQAVPAPGQREPGTPVWNLLFRYPTE